LQTVWIDFTTYSTKLAVPCEQMKVDLFTPSKRPFAESGETGSYKSDELWEYRSVDAKQTAIC